MAILKLIVRTSVDVIARGAVQRRIGNDRGVLVLPRKRPIS